jgi:hypothetical protein
VLWDVRFLPKADIAPCSKTLPYSITSSARARSMGYSNLIEIDEPMSALGQKKFRDNLPDLLRLFSKAILVLFWLTIRRGLRTAVVQSLLTEDVQ